MGARWEQVGRCSNVHRLHSGRQGLQPRVEGERSGQRGSVLHVQLPHLTLQALGTANESRHARHASGGSTMAQRSSAHLVAGSGVCSPGQQSAGHIQVSLPHSGMQRGQLATAGMVGVGSSAEQGLHRVQAALHACPVQRLVSITVLCLCRQWGTGRRGGVDEWAHVLGFLALRVAG